MEGSVGREGECGDEVEVLLVREIRSLEILSEEVSEAVTERRAWGRGR